MRISKICTIALSEVVQTNLGLFVDKLLILLDEVLGLRPIPVPVSRVLLHLLRFINVVSDSSLIFLPDGVPGLNDRRGSFRLREKTIQPVQWIG